MRNLRLISTTAAILLLGAGTVSAQSMKTDETPAAAPVTQQNAPAENVAPALKSSQSKAPDTTVQAAPATKGTSDANGSANVKSNKSAADAATPPGKSVTESKHSTTGQATADDAVVGGPKIVRHRHHHYRNCWPNIFNHGRCW
jgi:hypothetical protein